MFGTQFNSRWRHQYKPGQPVACRVVARMADGYRVEFGSEKLSGFLPAAAPVAPGSQLLLQFVGYKNQMPFFNASYGLNAYAPMR